MIALLRQVGRPGQQARARAGRACASIASRPTSMAELGCLLETQRRVGVSRACCKTRAAAAAEAFLAAHGDDLGKRSSIDLDVLLTEA